MDAKQFIAEFGHIIDAPSGVGELRKLVLHLAVTGKLVSSTGETTAKSFLEEIEIVKQERIALKEIKQNKKIEPLPSKFPFEIPNSWQWVRFGNLCHFVAGRTPPRKESIYWNTGEYPWFSIADMNHQEVITVSSETVSQEAREKSFKCSPVKAGTLIMSFKLTIGRLSVLGVDAYHNEAIISIYPFASELNDYFLKCLSGFDLSSGNKAAIKGNTLNQDSISNILVAVPPKGQIPALLTKVDELMSLCDQLEEQQQHKRQLQNQLRKTALESLAGASSPFELKQHWTRLTDNFGDLFSKSEDVIELKNLVLELGVNGHLTESLEGDEPAEELLNQIVLAKKNGIKKGVIKKKKPVVGDMLNNEFVKSYWAQLVLDEAIADIDAGWSPKCLAGQRKNESSWGVLKTTAVQPMAFLPFENKELPSSLEPRPQYEVKLGDILVTRAGPSNRVGISCVVDTAPPKLMISDKIIRFRIVDNLIDARFVALCLAAGESGRKLESMKTGMAKSQMNITQDRLRSLSIPLPPREEQRRILARIESILAICNKYEKKLANIELLGKRFTEAAVADLTGMNIIQEEGPLKVPKTELISPITLGVNKPSGKDDAPLATLLARQSCQMNANDLWQRFGGEIDAFYAQLKVEVIHGWIAEPETANILEKDEE
ncbi:restriction endonuclease subunit S [Vibrio splendidus]|uniref:restriction endonuclease subunit S n=1 Tax=Vibrio splendidus TaxID=29497 RepID=UPI0022365076|nr:restriction endonuclease subunit S [Vibrio splendidus]MCW4443734.1 restriction endonuclease subunit S [Vibrio splendidus]